MKITALLLLKCSAIDAILLSNSTDVNHFGRFQRSMAREFITFFARTVAKRTLPGQHQSLQHGEYKVYSYNSDGLCAMAFVDDHYPLRSAFCLLDKILDEYQKSFGDSWRTIQADITEPWPYLNEALLKFQDPAEVDKLLRIQRHLDETKIILHQIIDSILERGAKLDNLIEKSSDLSMKSQMFYRRAKRLKKTNQCCTLV